jgi:hypothetical protein
MRNRLIALTLALSSALAAPSVFAQTAVVHGDWAAVEALAAGTSVRVETMSGDTLNGKLSGVTDEALTLRHSGKPVVLNRNNIRRVYRREGSPRLRGALVGAAVGGTIGFGTGLGFYLPARNDIVGAVVPGFTIMGALAGAGIGAAFGRGTDKVLIYEAR